MFTLSYEYKLEPNQLQISMIEQTLDVCRTVWNYALRERKDWINSRKCHVNACSIEKEYIIPFDELYPSYSRQAKALTEAKKDSERLKSVNAQVLQQVLRTLDRAFSDMKSRGFGFPRFKNKYRLRSYLIPQLKGQVLKGNQVKLPQLGWVTFRKSREIPDGFKVRNAPPHSSSNSIRGGSAVKQARVIRKASGYFVMLSLQLDVDVPQPFPHGHPRGLDLGFDKFVATSDGLEVKRPRFLKSLQRKLKLLQRRLKNKKKGSNNRHKLNRKIARVHQRISDARKDWHFQLAHQLCDQAGMIFVEDINFRSWQRGMLSKHAADAGFGQFVNILEWVCWTPLFPPMKWGDVRGVAKVDKDGTSQECSQCGANTGKKTLDVRVHHCPECGYTGSRDVVSAEVIRNRGLSDLGQGLENKQIACGGDLTGMEATSSSQEPETGNLVARLGISRHSA